MSNLLTTTFVSFLLVFSPLVAYGGQQCTEEDFNKVVQAGYEFSEWSQLYDSYRKFKQCDDGGEVSEGYSDSVAHLFANHWDKLEQFAKISSKNKQFKKFVFRHIDATSLGDDLQNIAHLADTQCPNSNQSLCKEISLKAKAAKSELDKAIQ